MFSNRLKFFAFTAVALIVATAAQAADFAPPPPPPPVQHFGGGWYLRGQVGVGMLKGDQVEYIKNPANFNDFAFEQSDIGDTVFVGGGVGYEFNRWLRFDATAEYRSKARVKAFGSYTFGGGTFGDAYDGYIKSWLFLANAYVDLGTWNCLTPFVGAGIGGAYNTLADFTDIGIGTSGRGIGRDSSEWHHGLGALCGSCLRCLAEPEDRSDLSLPRLRLDHRHHRLHRRLQPGQLQVGPPDLARHHAGSAVQLLRVRGNSAAAQQGLSSRLMPREDGEDSR